MIRSLVSILVIDADIDFYNVLKNMLIDGKPVGWPIKYKVDNAPSLADAFRKLEAKEWDVIILDLVLPDSTKPYQTFYKLKTNIPVVVLTQKPNGMFEQVLAEGAYRCYSKEDFKDCMKIIHYTIRHVLAQKDRIKLINQQDETILGKLKSTIRECAGCRRWYDNGLQKWVSYTHFLKRRGFIISHGHCDDCERDFYGKDLQEMITNFE